MKKQMMFTISALLILLISVSCQGTATPTEEVLEPTQEPTVEPSPTLEPTAIPLEEPTATTAPTEAPVIELVPQEAILNITWQWADWLQNSPEAYAVVPVPENYTLTFLADNTFQFQADCNQGSGIYATDGLSMVLTLGAITAAECAADSVFGLPGGSQRLWYPGWHVNTVAGRQLRANELCQQRSGSSSRAA